MKSVTTAVRVSTAEDSTNEVSSASDEDHSVKLDDENALSKLDKEFMAVTTGVEAVSEPGVRVIRSDCDSKKGRELGVTSVCVEEAAGVVAAGDHGRLGKTDEEDKGTGAWVSEIEATVLVRSTVWVMPGEGKVVVSGTRIMVVKGELYSPDISVVTSREVVGHGALDSSLLVERNKSESRSDGDEL